MLAITLKPAKKKYRINWLESVRKKRNIKVLYKTLGKQKPVRPKRQTPKI